MQTTARHILGKWWMIELVDRVLGAEARSKVVKPGDGVHRIAEEKWRCKNVNRMASQGNNQKLRQ